MWWTERNLTIADKNKLCNVFPWPNGYQIKLSSWKISCYFQVHLATEFHHQTNVSEKAFRKTGCHFVEKKKKAAIYMKRYSKVWEKRCQTQNAKNHDLEIFKLWQKQTSRAFDRNGTGIEKIFLKVIFRNFLPVLLFKFFFVILQRWMWSQNLCRFSSSCSLYLKVLYFFLAFENNGN